MTATTDERDTLSDLSLDSPASDVPNYLHARIRFAALVLYEATSRGLSNAEAFRRLHTACNGHAPLANYKAFRDLISRQRDKVRHYPVVSLDISAIYEAAIALRETPVANAVGVFARSERGMIESEQNIDAEEYRAMARRLDTAITADTSGRTYWKFLEHYAQLLAR